MVRTTARYDGNVLVPDGPLAVPTHVPLEITISTPGEANSADRIRRLVGLGSEIWQGIDPVEYQRKERARWD